MQRPAATRFSNIFSHSARCSSHRPACLACMHRFRIITISMYISYSCVVGDVHDLSNSAIVNWVTSAKINAEVFSTLFLSSWTMEAIINMHSMPSVYEQGSMHHTVYMEHCIVILPRDNPVCFSMETVQGVFDFCGLHQIPNCSQEIPSNMKATHSQDELACFVVFFFCRPSTS